MEKEGKTMASSSNSKSLRSTDVSDPSLGGSKRLRRVERLCGKFEPEKGRVCTVKEIQDYVRPYALDAISFHNEITTGTKYELVEPGYFSHAALSGYLFTHIDFTAKKTDVADAPEEMFFAELTTINEVNSVKVCKCMGRKESISGDKNNGCCYCMGYIVQHPRDGGFTAGGVGLFTDEKRKF